MEEQARKALEQLREAAAQLGPEAFDATLMAIRLKAVSHTMLFLAATIGYVLLVRMTLQNEELKEDHIGPLAALTIFYGAIVCIFFGSAAWMGLVSPEAALAQEVLSRF